MNIMQKLFVVFAALTMTTVVGVQSSLAASVSPSIDLHVYESGAIGVVDNSLLVGYNAQNGQSVPYLKFDVSALKNQFSSITSATLMLTGSSMSPISNIDVLKTDDNWDASSISWANKPAILGILGSHQVPFSFAQSQLSWNLDAGQISDDVFNPNDGWLSLQLQVTDPFAIATFASSETQDSPMLVVNGAPVPEPSTAILGLLGIGGLLRRRRK